MSPLRLPAAVAAVPQSKTYSASPPGLRDSLEAGMRALALELPATAVAQLLAYLAELSKWNAAYNLTAVRDPREMVTRHLLDSLALLPVVLRHPAAARGALRLLDVGAGAGLPGIALAIAAPQFTVDLLDSNGKKARFMRHALRTLGLANANVIEARVENFQPAQRYDVIVSRAFASLTEFFDKSSHLLAEGGEWLAMKGKLDAREQAEVPPRYVVRETLRLTVPGLDEARHVLRAVPESRVPSSESRPS